MTKHNDDLEQFAKDQLKDIDEIAELLSDLTSRPGWVRLKELVEKQVQERMTTVMTSSDLQLRLVNPPTTVERLCGEAAGMRLAMSIPETFLTAHEDMKNASNKPDQSDVDE